MNDRDHVSCFLKERVLVNDNCGTTKNKEMENAALMRAARESLRGKWALAIGTFVIYSILTGAAGSIGVTASVLSLVLAGPFALGAAFFSLSLSRGKEASFEQLFRGFNYFTTALVAYLLVFVYVLLWTLLLIVPGIIAALSYAMTFYIIADEPSINAEDALKKSKAMMDGYKLKLFYLCLRFFLLGLLCILTLGIGFFWLVPFVHITMAKFYDDIKTR
jgi:uncharacterized membrane protein